MWSGSGPLGWMAHLGVNHVRGVVAFRGRRRQETQAASGLPKRTLGNEALKPEVLTNWPLRAGALSSATSSALVRCRF